MRYEEGRISVEQVFPILVGEWDVRQPELKMWAVCLAQAIAGAIGLIRSHDLRLWRKDDRYWLIRDKGTAVGSCHWICEVLDIDRAELVSFVWRNRHELRRSPCRLRSLN